MPRPVPVKLQTAMEAFECRLRDLQLEYVVLREIMIEHHARDRSELSRQEQAGDRFDQQLAHVKADSLRLQETMLTTFQTMLTAIAEISATLDREIAVQRNASAALPARSPDSDSSCPPASDSKTCQDAAASGLPAVGDSDPPT